MAFTLVIIRKGSINTPFLAVNALYEQGSSRDVSSGSIKIMVVIFHFTLGMTALIIMVPHVAALSLAENQAQV